MHLLIVDPVFQIKSPLISVNQLMIFLLRFCHLLPMFHHLLHLVEETKGGDIAGRSINDKQKWKNHL